MTKQFIATALLSAAVLLTSASFSAFAIDVNAGNGGASVGTGGSAGNNNGTGTIGQGNGPLATVDNNGNPTGEGSQTDGNVNFGSLLAGLDLSGIDTGNGGVGGNDGANGSNGSIGGGSGGARTLAANLSAGDRQKLKDRCRGVLASPSNFQPDAVFLCKKFITI